MGLCAILNRAADRLLSVVPDLLYPARDCDRIDQHYCEELATDDHYRAELANVLNMTRAEVVKRANDPDFMREHRQTFAAVERRLHVEKRSQIANAVTDPRFVPAQTFNSASSGNTTARKSGLPIFKILAGLYILDVLSNSTQSPNPPNSYDC